MGSGLPYAVLSRLPGVRWADRRAELAPSQSWALIAAVGRLLRRLHQLPGARFGALVPHGRSWPSAWQRVDERCDRLIRSDLAAGGSAYLTGRVRRFVDRHRSALASCHGPVLCHNDFIDSNILVNASGDPAVCGVVDLERASWDDPLCDLAGRTDVDQLRPPFRLAAVRGRPGGLPGRTHLSFLHPDQGYMLPAKNSAGRRPCRFPRRWPDSTGWA